MISMKIIQSVSDYKFFIHHDRASMGLSGKNLFEEYLKGNTDEVLLYLYLRSLRRFEYLTNNRKGFMNIPYILYKHYFKWLRRHTGIYLSPNVFSPGIHLVHYGYCWVDASSRIGSNCTILPRVLLGKKKPGIKPPCIFIGNDCYIGTGVTILGPVHIGNNVTIAAGSVVTSDIPDNVIVAGIPAKTIRIKIEKEVDE